MHWQHPRTNRLTDGHEAEDEREDDLCTDVTQETDDGVRRLARSGQHY